MFLQNTCFMCAFLLLKKWHCNIYIYIYLILLVHFTHHYIFKTHPCEIHTSKWICMIVRQPCFTHFIFFMIDRDWTSQQQVLTYGNFFGIYAEEQNARLSNANCPIVLYQSIFPPVRYVGPVHMSKMTGYFPAFCLLLI